MSNINVMRKNLGPVTAYKYAVQQGYTGTEQEFAALMASYATVAETATQAADDAVDAKTAAQAAQAAAEAAAQSLEIDDTLTQEGQAADAKATGDEINDLSEALETEKDRAKSEEERIEALFTQPVEEAVSDWLDAHPEATTTVQDYSLTVDKIVIGALGYVTPQMYGAKADGITDDASAINSALGSGYPVFFPSGTYYFNSRIVIGQNNTLLYCASNVVFRAGSSSVNTIYFDHVDNVHLYFNGAQVEDGTINTGHVVWGYATNVIIDGLKINGSSRYHDCLCISYGAKNWTVRNCDISNGGRNSISVVEAENITIDHCKIHGTNTTAPYAAIDCEANLFTKPCKNVSITNCQIYDNRVGIMLSFVKGVKVIGNYLYGNGIAGFPLEGGDIIAGGVSGAQFGNDAPREGKEKFYISAFDTTTGEITLHNSGASFGAVVKFFRTNNEHEYPTEIQSNFSKYWKVSEENGTKIKVTLDNPNNGVSSFTDSGTLFLASDNTSEAYCLVQSDDCTSNIIIEDNLIETTVPHRNNIQVVFGKNVKILNNTIVILCIMPSQVSQPIACGGIWCTINGNRVIGYNDLSGYGIDLSGLWLSDISDNYCKNIGGYALFMSNSSYRNGLNNNIFANTHRLQASGMQNRIVNLVCINGPLTHVIFLYNGANIATNIFRDCTFKGITGTVTFSTNDIVSNTILPNGSVYNNQI